MLPSVTVTVLAFVTATIFSQVTAHPGHDQSHKIAERTVFYHNSAKRDLSHCSDTLKKRGQTAKQHARRQVSIESARIKRGLPKAVTHSLVARTWTANTTHLSDLAVNSTTSGVEEIIYANSSCLLSPEGEIGPFYVGGEFIRTDIAEEQAGVATVIDAQFIDVATCEPISNLMWDVWHANSTGVYGGVVGSGNGNENDLSNLNNTFLRGLTVTDDDGVAQFDTIFPGHYGGRATHIHVVGRLNGTILDNGTYTGGTVSHVGQLFFDQDLISAVNLLEPYIDNTVAIVENEDDKVVSTEITNDADPFFTYVLLGDDVSDGLFMWITLGVDLTAEYTASAAAELTAAGGVETSSGSSGGGGGVPPAS